MDQVVKMSKGLIYAGIVCKLLDLKIVCQKGILCRPKTMQWKDFKLNNFSQKQSTVVVHYVFWFSVFHHHIKLSFLLLI